jgi:hypothetical protein
MKSKDLTSDPNKKEVFSEKMIPDNPPIIEKCPNNNLFPILDIPSAPESLTVHYELYGNKKRAFLGFYLPKYIHDRTPIQWIVICDENGFIFSKRNFYPALDLSLEDQSFKSIALEGLDLSQSNEIYFVFFLLSQDSFIFKPEKKISFLKEIENQPVVDSFSKKTTVITMPFHLNSDFNFFENETIYLLQSKKDVEKSSFFKESIITDIGGRVISPLGSDFKDIIQYPIFVSYKKEITFFERKIFWISS